MTGIRDIWLPAHNMLRSARHIINESLLPLNLSSAEGNILLHLLTQGDAMGQEQLAEQLDISKPAVSRTLDSLEAKGYVTRLLDPEDRRAHRVALTGRARAIAPRLEQVYNHVYTLAFQGVSPEELGQFLELLSRVSENFAGAQAKKQVEKRDGA